MVLQEQVRVIYGEDTPLFAQAIAERLSLDVNTVVQALKRWKNQGIVEKWGHGVYYFPKESRFFGKKKLSSEKVIQSKYLGDEVEPNGYYSDLALANLAGITTQMAAVKTIVTNATSSKKRKINVGERTVYLKAPRVRITKDNIKAMELLDLLTVVNRYSEYDWEDTKRMIQDFVRKNNIRATQVQSIIKEYPKEAIENIVLMEAYSAFT